MSPSFSRLIHSTHSSPSLTQIIDQVAEWNDLPSVEKALAHGDVACILTEPALTNIGIVPPAPGFLEVRFLPLPLQLPSFL